MESTKLMSRGINLSVAFFRSILFHNSLTKLKDLF